MIFIELKNQIKFISLVFLYFINKWESFDKSKTHIKRQYRKEVEQIIESEPHPCA